MDVISIQKLTKDYGNHKGIFNLSFSVKNGEVFGFLGPNGSGKTTTIRHLLGLLNPDSGTCTINCIDCRTAQKQIQPFLGYLPGEIALFDDMTGSAFLKFMANMRKLTNLTRMHQLIDTFELNPSGRIKRMSKGMKQKVAIVTAFMHNPTVLILDEPTSGLDPLMQNRFIELIQQEKAKGSTIIMSSHSFDEVERTCDRAAIIKDGSLITTETVKNLKSSQKKSYIVTFNTQADCEKFANEPFLSTPLQALSCEVNVGTDLNALIAVLAGYDIASIDKVTKNLEDIFMQYYKGGSDNA